ncbi:MAG: OmpA family protein [Myxococcota bacterium]|jgi:chemotaxis protein MotB
MSRFLVTAVLAAFVLAIFSGCVAKGKYDEEARALQQVRQDKAATDGALADCSKKLTFCEKAAAEIAVAAVANGQKALFFERLALVLKAETEVEALELANLAGKMTIRMKDDVLFESGSAKIHKAGEQKLAKISEALKQIPDKYFLVEGHTDNVPLKKGSAYADNWDLSWYRAKSVVDVLIKNGVPKASLGAAGLGDNQPMVPNDTDANKAKNRRIEIEIY